MDQESTATNTHEYEKERPRSSRLLDAKNEEERDEVNSRLSVENLKLYDKILESTSFSILPKIDLKRSQSFDSDCDKVPFWMFK